MKMKKSFAALLTLLMVLCLALPCSAAESNRFLQQVQLTNNALVIYSDAVSSDVDFTVALGGEKLPYEMQTVEESGEPITYFCIVDVSGTMRGMPMELTKQTLTGISDHMRSQDNMVIGTFTDSLSLSDPMEAGDELTQAIDAIAVGGGDTNLYNAIMESVQCLSSDTAYHTKKCLVVFSDGEECQDNGLTDAEVLQAVEQADIPIYTVAAMTQADQLPNGKIMGSFGRASAGGEHFTTANEEGGTGSVRQDVSGTDIADEILADMLGGAVITADLTDYEPQQQRNEVTLKVTLSDGNTETRTLLTDDLLAVIGAGDFMKEDASKDEPAPSPTPDPGPQWLQQLQDLTGLSAQMLLYIAAGAAAVLVIVIVLIIVIVHHKRRKNRAAGAPPVEDIPETGGIEDTHSLEDGDDQSQENHSDVLQTEKIESGIPVFMIEIPYGRHQATFMIPGPGVILTVGRNNRADAILRSNDNKLSSIHFSLICQNNNFFVQDENSTNGTLLNGLNIAGKGWRPIKSGDKLKAGEMEYRVLLGEDVEML